MLEDTGSPESRHGSGCISPIMSSSSSSSSSMSAGACCCGAALAEVPHGSCTAVLLQNRWGATLVASWCLLATALSNCAEVNAVNVVNENFCRQQDQNGKASWQDALDLKEWLFHKTINRIS